MRRNHSTRYFNNQDNAQPWDSYVTGTVSSSGQDNEKKDKRPKR